MKDNPLVPTLSEAAGDCLDHKGCQEAAKKVVKLMTVVYTELERKRQKEQEEARGISMVFRVFQHDFELELITERQRAQKEEENRAKEKARLEKKAEKDKRKGEAQKPKNQPAVAEHKPEVKKSLPEMKNEKKAQRKRQPVQQVATGNLNFRIFF